MATGLIDVMKRAALDVNSNMKPTDLRYGTVISVSPLKVRITNNFTIPSSMLIVPKRLTKDAQNGVPLAVGDKVALLRQQGGQYYFVLDQI